MQARQRLEGIRKQVGAWHLGATYEDRNDPLSQIQSRTDFNSNEISLDVQTAATRVIANINPLGANERKEGVTLANLLFEYHGKVMCRRDAVNVNKDVTRSYHLPLPFPSTELTSPGVSKSSGMPQMPSRRRALPRRGSAVSTANGIANR